MVQLRKITRNQNLENDAKICVRRSPLMLAPALLIATKNPYNFARFPGWSPNRKYLETKPSEGSFSSWNVTRPNHWPPVTTPTWFSVSHPLRVYCVYVFLLTLLWYHQRTQTSAFIYSKTVSQKRNTSMIRLLATVCVTLIGRTPAAVWVISAVFNRYVSNSSNARRYDVQ